MKQQIKELIDRMADRGLARGAEVYMGADSGIDGYGNIQCVRSVCEPIGEMSLYGHNLNPKTHTVKEVLGHPVLKCHVEAKIPLKQLCFYQKGEVLTQLWHAVDPTFSKSLQEIFDCEWEECARCDADVCSAHQHGQLPKDPNIKALGEFLLSLNLIAE